jgi:hypothetical protein
LRKNKTKKINIKQIFFITFLSVVLIATSFFAFGFFNKKTSTQSASANFISATSYAKSNANTRAITVTDYYNQLKTDVVSLFSQPSNAGYIGEVVDKENSIINYYTGDNFSYIDGKNEDGTDNVVIINDANINAGLVRYTELAKLQAALGNETNWNEGNFNITPTSLKSLYSKDKMFFVAIDIINFVKNKSTLVSLKDIATEDWQVVKEKTLTFINSNEFINEPIDNENANSMYPRSEYLKLFDNNTSEVLTNITVLQTFAKAVYGIDETGSLITPQINQDQINYILDNFKGVYKLISNLDGLAKSFDNYVKNILKAEIEQSYNNYILNSYNFGFSSSDESNWFTYEDVLNKGNIAEFNKAITFLDNYASGTVKGTYLSIDEETVWIVGKNDNGEKAKLSLRTAFDQISSKISYMITRFKAQQKYYFEVVEESADSWCAEIKKLPNYVDAVLEDLSALNALKSEINSFINNEGLDQNQRNKLGNYVFRIDLNINYINSNFKAEEAKEGLDVVWIIILAGGGFLIVGFLILILTINLRKKRYSDELPTQNPNETRKDEEPRKLPKQLK